MLKWLVIVLLLTIFVIVASELIKNLPKELISWTYCENCGNASEEVFEITSYEELKRIQINASAPLLYENIRWNHMPIKVYLDLKSAEGISWFSSSNIKSVRDAMLEWEEKTNGTVSFLEVSSPKDADVIVEWAKSIESKRVLGTGGPTVLNTGLFNLTVNGSVSLVPSRIRCIDLNTAVHEFGHVLGFAHSTNPLDVMYPTAGCSQSITEEEAQTLSELYKVEPKPELYFLNASASRLGSYLNLAFSIKNSGILDSSETSIALKVDDTEIRSYRIPKLGPAESLIERIDNIAVSKKFNSIKLVLDKDNIVDEIYEENNEILLSLA